MDWSHSCVPLPPSDHKRQVWNLHESASVTWWQLTKLQSYVQLIFQFLCFLDLPQNLIPYLPWSTLWHSKFHFKMLNMLNPVILTFLSKWPKQCNLPVLIISLMFLISSLPLNCTIIWPSLTVASDIRLIMLISCSSLYTSSFLTHQVSVV